MTNINTFLDRHEITFDTQKQKISWIRRNLRPKTLVKVGPNYLVDESEIELLFKDYVKKQVELTTPIKKNCSSTKEK